MANSDICGEPGINAKHLERLTKLAKEYESKHQRKLMCSLCFDEMNIRQQILWSAHQLNYLGYTKCGQNPDDDEKNIVAKQALVYILNGIDVNFEYPIAYFFINTLKANQRANILDDIIKEVTKCGIKITNVTFDGYSGNVPMCEILGANLDVFSDHFKPFINNPSNNEKIYITPDACHMEKLVRNTLASKKVFYDANNNRIEWRYIEALHEYTLNHDFRTHKLTKKHVHFKRNIMNVRIAAQTFSLSVANSIQFLMEQNVPEFQDAWPTIKFIRRMDKLFNVFNSRQLDDKNIFKRALSASNKRIIFDFLTECIEFFKTLKIQGEVSVRRKSKAKKANKTKKTGYIIKKTKKMILLLKSKNKCSFRGFIIGAHSIMRMYKCGRLTTSDQYMHI